MRVVDLLEVIQIQRQDRQWVAVLARRGDRLLGCDAEVASIRQTGQRIGRGLRNVS